MNTIGIKMNTIRRIVLFMISYFIIVDIFQYVGILIADVDITDSENTKSYVQQLTISVFDLVETFLLLYLFMKFVNKEQFIKLGFQTKNRLKEFVSGIILGLVIMSLGYLLLIYFEEVWFLKVNFNLTN